MTAARCLHRRQRVVLIGGDRWQCCIQCGRALSLEDAAPCESCERYTDSEIANQPQAERSAVLARVRRGHGHPQPADSRPERKSLGGGYLQSCSPNDFKTPLKFSFAKP